VIFWVAFFPPGFFWRLLFSGLGGAIYSPHIWATGIVEPGEKENFKLLPSFVVSFCRALLIKVSRNNALGKV